jgi:adenylate cyclase
MPDIFISYSRKDSDVANQLVELLESAGISSWIDKSGIELATHWSKEIVQAIDGSKAFVLLLSKASNSSVNVHKEVHLASEKHKKILILELDPVQLSDELQYPLAGLQRAPISNIDAVIRALGRLGLEATGAPKAPTIVRQTDTRKPLMILPFEDLSPTGDNAWFSDGIVSELITALSNVKALKVVDAHTTKEFKSYKGPLTAYAREMAVRYFVQGDVRKFGDNIKISARLLDVETGDHLWQDALKGTMDDIFEIQEQVAKKVVDGLNVLLTQEEVKMLSERATSNAEAYELWMKAVDLLWLSTKEDIERAMFLLEEALNLDPNYVAAHAEIANAALAMYLNYGYDPKLLDRASTALERFREIEGETPRYYWLRSRVTLQQGHPAEARAFAEKAIQQDPTFAPPYDALGFALQALDDRAGAAKAWMKYIEIWDTSRTGHFNLLIELHTLGTQFADDLHSVAERAVPLYRRHIRLHPDDFNRRVELATIFVIAGLMEEAVKEADELSQVESLDGVPCYNLACIYLHAHDNTRALAMLRRAVTRGYRNRENLLRDPDLAPLREMPEFEEIMREL